MSGFLIGRGWHRSAPAPAPEQTRWLNSYTPPPLPPEQDAETVAAKLRRLTAEDAS
jgi:hypothetical protein